ncbi:MAG: MgPME-cyclase complex family protein [Prochlorococcus sp.]
MFPLPTGASAATALVSTNQDFSLFLKLRMECVLQQVFEAQREAVQILLLAMQQTIQPTKALRTNPENGAFLTNQICWHQYRLACSEAWLHQW